MIDEPEKGPTWAERALLAGGRAVLDPAGDPFTNALYHRLQERTVRRALPRSRDIHILDFGCGTGRMSTLLRSWGASVVGIDPSQEMVRAAARGDASGMYARASSDLPFRSEAFHTVLSVGVLQYVARDLDRLCKTMREVNRVLCEGGQLLAIEHVASPTLGRGTTLVNYRSAIEQAGFGSIRDRPIRVSPSRMIRLALAHPSATRVPGFASLARLEGAAVRALKPIDGDRYLEMRFIATKIALERPCPTERVRDAD